MDVLHVACSHAPCHKICSFPPKDGMQSVSNHCNLIVMLSFTLHKDACNTHSCRKKTRQQIRGLEVTLFPEGQVHGGSTLKKKLKVR